MVELSRIYTRGGDKGKTSLSTGERVAKYDLRVEAYGTVDEANATLGLARLEVEARMSCLPLFSVFKMICSILGLTWQHQSCLIYPMNRCV